MVPYIGRVKTVAVERLAQRREELQDTEDPTIRAIIEKDIEFLEEFLKAPIVCNTE